MKMLNESGRQREISELMNSLKEIKADTKIRSKMVAEKWQRLRAERLKIPKQK